MKGFKNLGDYCLKSDLKTAFKTMKTSDYSGLDLTPFHTGDWFIFENYDYKRLKISTFAKHYKQIGNRSITLKSKIVRALRATKNTTFKSFKVNAGDIIVIDTNGESCIVKKSTFSSKYKKVEG